MPSRKLWYLRRLNLFEGMTANEIELVSRGLYERPCRKRESVYNPQRGGNQIYLVKEGAVRLYRLNPEGREITIAVLRPGQIFGLSSLFGAAQPSTFAEAIEDTYICEAGTQEFMRLMAAHPTLATKVTLALAKQLFRLEQLVESLAFKEVPSRLAELLLALAEGNGEGMDQKIVPGAYTHEELAKMIGSTRESVSRTLSDFQTRGLVEVVSHHIILKDPASLREIATGEIEAGD